MDSSPLDQAYSLCSKADLEVQRCQYSKAADLYSQASVKYALALELTSSPEALRTIRLLKSQTEANARFLADESNHIALPQPSSASNSRTPRPPAYLSPVSQSSSRAKGGASSHEQHSSPISSDHLTSSLASARGKKHPPSANHHTQTFPSPSGGRRIDTISEESQVLEFDTSRSSSPISNNANNSSESGSNKPQISPEDDPFFKFYSTVTTIISKTYDQTRDTDKVASKYSKSKGTIQGSSKPGTSNEPSAKQIVSNLRSQNVIPKDLSTSSSSLSESTLANAPVANMTSSMGPTDSYYVVSPTLNYTKGVPSRLGHPKRTSSMAHRGNGNISLGNQDLSSENAALRAQLEETSLALEAYYDTFERQQAVLKASLAQLRADVQAQERRKAKESKQVIDALKEENGKLKTQVSKMKTRWEGLKESARKRVSQ